MHGSGICSGKDKPATDGDGGGFACDEDKATSARFAIANSRPGDAEARVFFPTRRCANAESTATDRTAQAGLAQVYSEETEINRFAVGESHQNSSRPERRFSVSSAMLATMPMRSRSDWARSDWARRAALTVTLKTA